MDPQQELFSLLLTQIRDLGYDVYDGFLPPEGTSYPFVYMADSETTDTNYKDAVGGTVNQTIHFYSNNPRKRGSLSAVMLNVKTMLRKIDTSNNFTWVMKGMNQRILADSTTNEPLLHGIIEAEFSFT